jgi:metal-responsive CopG/Arc/MetJ family transcriptional regulator
MSSKRINITIPEENLKEINKFCSEEKMSKSQLIREAASQYIASIKELKEKEQRRRDVEWAIEMQEVYINENCYRCLYRRKVV